MRQSRQFENPADGRSDGRVLDRFHVEITPDRDVVRVSPVGELELSTAGELAATMKELRRSGFARVVLDLRDTTFIDSSGVHVILDEYAAVEADGGDFAIVPGPPAVQRIFDVTGLATRLPFLDGSAESNGAVPNWLLR